ncbi:hypothetical protein [Sulfobacillus harzensis]|uniref:Uncharacterized protein n=1 Tax=Sulfobacillus harzensis TaxID=2729629 RepID=A0A7Y0Q2S0_9FIRM|nr:hypothetical protein [Sulfobacillus harzensis]NMP22186.1 hypothetical protein [Sulfobacillus harzensis]
MTFPKRLKLYWLLMKFGWRGHRQGYDGEALRDYMFREIWPYVQRDAPGWSYQGFRRWMDTYRATREGR